MAPEGKAYWNKDLVVEEDRILGGPEPFMAKHI